MIKPRNVFCALKNLFSSSSGYAQVDCITTDVPKSINDIEINPVLEKKDDDIMLTLPDSSNSNAHSLSDDNKIGNKEKCNEEDHEEICAEEIYNKIKTIPEWIANNLNTEQIESVTNTEGYIRVIAGAGTGKTKALTYRYSYLVKELGVLPRNILCVTFTNKAANEMKERIRALIGDNDLGFICTFHSACLQILREDIYHLGYPKSFMILDNEDVKTILKTVYEDVGLKSTEYTFNKIKDMIKKKKFSSDYISLLNANNWIELREKSRDSINIDDKIFFGYLYEQRKCYGLDFDDLLYFTLYLFKSKETVLNKWQKRFNYVMVDEFQDVSSTQYCLAEYLSGIYKNLFIVGDPDQTIYGWRGAHVEFILDFDKAFPDVKTIIMNQNYRSTINILEASNSLITKNKMRIDKFLFTNNNHHEPVEFYHALSQKMESIWIAQVIKDYENKGIKLSSICILYRAHYISRNIEEALVEKNIPYKIYSGVEFYQRKEIKDILAYLRMVIYLDDLSFLRIINEPKRGFGKKRLEFLKDFASVNNCTLYTALKENIRHSYFTSDKFTKFIELIDFYSEKFSVLKISDLLSELLVKSGYESMLAHIGEQERLDNISELKQSVFDYETSQNEECSLEDYLSHIALFTNMDKKDLSTSVKLMTIHSAKGLEFPIVFVCSMNEGVFPGKHVDTIPKLEEERRLAYVAFTRAKEKLFLSDSEGFNYDNSFRHPSRFILNIDDKLVTYINPLPELTKESALQYIKENEEFIAREKFKAGDKVNHSHFGKGEIKSIIKDSGYVIKFEQFTLERTVSFTSPLKKI